MTIIHYEIKLRRKNYIIILSRIINQNIIILDNKKRGFLGDAPKKSFYKGKGRAPGSPSNNLIENKF